MINERTYRINLGIEEFNGEKFFTAFDNWMTVKGKERLKEALSKVCKRANEYVEEDVE